MARITVEDCERIVDNRFDLVVLAAQRTRQIINGDKIKIDIDDEKKPVISLREIAAQAVSVDALKEDVIRSFRKFTPEEEISNDLEELPDDNYNPSDAMDISAISGSNQVVDEVESDSKLASVNEKDDIVDR